VIRSKCSRWGRSAPAFEAEFAARIACARTSPWRAAPTPLAARPSWRWASGRATRSSSRPSTSWPRPNMSVLRRARPVFCDIGGLDDPTLDPALLEGCLSPATRGRGRHALWRGRLPDGSDRRRGRASGDRRHRGRLPRRRGAYRGTKMGAWGDVGRFLLLSNKNMATARGHADTHRGTCGALRLMRSHGMSTLTCGPPPRPRFSYDVSTTA